MVLGLRTHQKAEISIIKTTKPEDDKTLYVRQLSIEKETHRLTVQRIGWIYLENDRKDEWNGKHGIKYNVMMTTLHFTVNPVWWWIRSLKLYRFVPSNAVSILGGQTWYRGCNSVPKKSKRDSNQVRRKEASAGNEAKTLTSSKLESQDESVTT